MFIFSQRAKNDITSLRVTHYRQECSHFPSSSRGLAACMWAAVFSGK
jgi:hypothetical protein